MFLFGLAPFTKTFLDRSQCGQFLTLSSPMTRKPPAQWPDALKVLLCNLTAEALRVQENKTQKVRDKSVSGLSLSKDRDNIDIFFCHQIQINAKPNEISRSRFREAISMESELVEEAVPRGGSNH